MLVENRFPADARVRNEAFTLVQNGYRVSVIALRGAAEPRREIVNGVTVYRVPRTTLFEKLPDASSRLMAIVKSLQAVAGYVVPSTGSILDLAAANWNTALGAACFLACALATLRTGHTSKSPRLRRLHDLEQEVRQII